ncbi:MAG: hypothetical protein WCF67_14430, partial [Chitinophagaceae bacterium]
FKGDATILKDTSNEFNRYPSSQAIMQYIPSLIDVQFFEEILNANYVADGEVAGQGNSETFSGYYKKHKRQYSGYISSAADTLLVVCFLNFSNKRKAKQFFSNWKYQNGYLGSGLFLDSSPPHIYCYSVNRRTKAINRYKLP